LLFACYLALRGFLPGNRPADCVEALLESLPQVLAVVIEALPRRELASSSNVQYGTASRVPDRIDNVGVLGIATGTDNNNVRRLAYFTQPSISDFLNSAARDMRVFANRIETENRVETMLAVKSGFECRSEILHRQNVDGAVKGRTRNRKVLPARGEVGRREITGAVQLQHSDSRLTRMLIEVAYHQP
jgi:hypothetical protein